MSLLTTFALLLAMNPQPAQDLSGTTDTKITKVKFDASKWKLDWSDEFDKDGAPDPKKWIREVGYLRNAEQQYYTKDRPENARVEGGKLIIEARKDNFENKPITSASLTTEGIKSFLYGRIEARAKVPTGRGTWPAFWTLGENIRTVGWPKCGEIDILENVGFDPLKVHTNIHSQTYNHTKNNGKGNNMTVSPPWESFNVYAVEWYEDRIECFFNDIRYMVYKNEGKGDGSWPFDKNQYVILNLAIGGGWGGAQGVDESLFPHRYEIDYVRYYKLKK